MIRGEAERPELTGSALEWAGEGEGLETIIHYLLLQHTISNDHRLSIGDCDVRSPCAKVLRILYNCFLRIFLVFQLVITAYRKWLIYFICLSPWMTHSVFLVYKLQEGHTWFTNDSQTVRADSC